jgi:hypothetical protein
VISTQGKILYHTKIKNITYGISLRTFTIEIESWLILSPTINLKIIYERETIN